MQESTLAVDLILCPANDESFIRSTFTSKIQMLIVAWHSLKKIKYNDRKKKFSSQNPCTFLAETLEDNHKKCSFISSEWIQGTQDISVQYLTVNTGPCVLSPGDFTYGI